MSTGNIIVVSTCLIVFSATFFMTGHVGAYLNLPAFLAVLSGTLGAAFLSFPAERVKNALAVAKGSYTGKTTTPDEIVGVLLDMSIRCRLDGLQSLEKKAADTTIFFLRDALQMLADNYRVEDIRDILTTEIFFFKRRRMAAERVFRTMAAYAPSFGLAGSVIGLIGLLFGLGDSGEILRFIPIALISTLYGILAGNFIFTPLAELVRDRTEREILTQKMIIEGVAAIKTETNPYILEKKLSSFLTPAARHEARQSFAEIRQKYLRIAKARRMQAQQDPTQTAASKPEKDDAGEASHPDAAARQPWTD